MIIIIIIIISQVISLIFSLVYMQQELNQLGVANINGALFLMELQMTVGFIFNVIMVCNGVMELETICKEM